MALIIEIPDEEEIEEEIEIDLDVEITEETEIEETYSKKSQRKRKLTKYS